MRADVKVFLVCLVVVAIFLVAYFMLGHHSKSSITAENVLPSQQPALTPTTPAAIPNVPAPTDNNLTQGMGQAGGGAAISNDQLGVVPAAGTPATTLPDQGTNVGGTLGVNIPPATMQGQIQPGGQISMNQQAAGDQGASASGGIGQGLASTAAGGNSGSTGLDNSAGSTGLNTATGSSRHHHHHRAGIHHGQSGTYTIRHGDTLAGISRRIFGNGRMVRAIERANPGLDPRRLRVGEKIKLPHSHSSLSKRATAISKGRHHHYRRNTSVHGSRTYVVRRGDTLMRIARSEYHKASDWKLIYHANRRLIGSSPTDLRVGERLVIPAR